VPRGSATQTRTFTWSGNDLASATNPENGTVSYIYDASEGVLTGALRTAWKLRIDKNAKRSRKNAHVPERSRVTDKKRGKRPL
jgi:hypothetical protein